MIKQELLPAFRLHRAAIEETVPLGRVAGAQAEQEAAVRRAETRVWLICLFALAIAAIAGIALMTGWSLFRRERALAASLARERTAWEEQALLACAVEQTQDPIIIADRTGVIRYVNPAFTRVTGYSAEEALGVTPGSLLKSGQHDKEFYRMVWDTVLSRQTWRGVLTNRKKSGELYVVDESISPILDSDGTVTRFVPVQRDLTKQRRLEQEIRQLEKLEAVGQLACGVAHDFNNLLTPILGHAELLRATAASSEEAATHITAIQHAAHMAAALTRQLLNFGQPRSGEPQVIDINELLKELSALLIRTLGEHIELRLEADPSIGSFLGHAASIETVILNLAVNARDAMPAGGRLTVRTETVTVEAGAPAAPASLPPGSYVRLSVSDTGQGMPPEVQARMFEPFFTTKTKGRRKGTGLGLAIVKQIVDEMGGCVTVTSEVGQGTTFALYFPRTVRQKPHAVAPPPETTVAGSETVVLVEDDKSIRDLASSFLRGQGYTVLEAPDAEAALRLADTYTGAIEALVTDMVLPGLNGRQLAARLRVQHPRLKVLYVSGWGSSVLAGFGGSIEPGMLLPKPYTPSGLAKRIRALLDR